MVGLPNVPAEWLARPWMFVNPDNIRPQPHRRGPQVQPSSEYQTIPFYYDDSADVVTIAEPGYVPTQRSEDGPTIRGVMGLTEALNNSFVNDTLYASLGRPEGGIRKEERIEELDHVIAGDNGLNYGAWYQPYSDRIELTKGSYREREFATTLTHELVHGATSRGLPEDLRDRDALQLLLDQINYVAGEDGAANALAHALAAIRSAPDATREEHAMVASVVPAGTPDGYKWGEAEAAAAVDWWYKALGRE